MTERRDTDEASSPGSVPPGDGDRLPSLPRRALQVFVAPGELFDRLRERPAWIGVILLVAALSLASTLLVPEEMMRAAMVEQMPEGTSAEDVEQMTGFLRTAGMVAAAVGPLLTAVVVAGLSHLVFTLILGGRSTFRQLFSAASHVMLIPTVGSLLTVPLILATGEVQTSLTLHLLAPGLETGSYAYRMLRGLNVFGLAAAAVMGVAVGRLYPNRSAGSAIGVLVALYVTMKAVMALFTVAPGA